MTAVRALCIRTCKRSLFALSILLEFCFVVIHVTYFFVFNFFDLWYFNFSVSSGNACPLLLQLFIWDLFLFYSAMCSGISSLYFSLSLSFHSFVFKNIYFFRGYSEMTADSYLNLFIPFVIVCVRYFLLQEKDQI